MGRPRQFDDQAVLDRAVELFWRQGYEATSVADLTRHLGIGRASLYACFGSKHELYVKALRRYTETRDASAVELLSQGGPVLPAIRAVLESAVRDARQDHRGCMVTNASFTGGGDPAVQRCLEGSWSELETVLTSALTRARHQGEVSASVEPRPAARMLVVLLQGLQVMACGHDGDQRCRDAVDVALATLA